MVKGNRAHKRDEVENNVGMMGNDAEKRDVLRCFWRKLTALILGMPWL